MKAIRVEAFGEPEAMCLIDIPSPVPGAGEVLVRVAAAGVNPVDTYIRSGQYGDRPLPFTPGLDFAGQIEALGPGVSGFRTGDRVYGWRPKTGSYAAELLCDADQLHELPGGVGFPEGASLGVPYHTACRALFQLGRARQGETVLIHGASGGVGLAAVQLAIARGLSVIGTAGSEKGLKLLRAQGVQHVCNHRAANHFAELQAVASGRGIDLVVEMLGNVNLGGDLGLLAKGGRVVVVGSRGPVEIDPRDLMIRDASVCGFVLFNIPPEAEREAGALVARWCADGSIRPVVGKILPLEAAPEAHHWIMERPAAGRIVLVP